jgi:hypothetical protein
VVGGSNSIEGIGQKLLVQISDGNLTHPAAANALATAAPIPVMVNTLYCLRSGSKDYPFRHTSHHCNARKECSRHFQDVLVLNEIPVSPLFRLVDGDSSSNYA